jgi:hypothetical protein
VHLSYCRLDSRALEAAAGQDVRAEPFYPSVAHLICLPRVCSGIRDVSAARPRYLEWRDLYSLLREAIAIPIHLLRPASA